MAVTSNKLIPVVTLAAGLMVAVVLYKQFTGPASAVKADPALTAVPKPDAPKLPKTAGADADTPSETLNTVAVSNVQLREDVKKVIERNNELIKENERLKANGGVAAANAATEPSTPASAPVARPGGGSGLFDSAIDTAARAADTFTSGMNRAPSSATAPTVTQTYNYPHPTKGPGGVSTLPTATGVTAPPLAPGEVAYSVMAPMGYAAQTDQAKGAKGVAMTRYVRTMQPEGEIGAVHGPATAAAERAAHKKAEDIPYFTIPENGTLAGVTAMTSIIGRVPIDGRVTDPMQFKAVVGRDNLAANGFELPGDLAGMIVTGIAIGDMALSCNEGRVRSVTFVFNDGTVRTVSSRSRNSGVINRSSGSSNQGDLGFISDLHGNPCIPGKFVTNAPAYLTDIIGLKSLGVAGQAFADAQRTTRANNDGSYSSTVTGNTNDYALGQAVSGATDEVTRWMLQRLKSSFDAVISPSGLQMVVHLDQEIKIDKVVNARKLVHRQQTQVSQGGHYGLD